MKHSDNASGTPELLSKLFDELLSELLKKDVTKRIQVDEEKAFLFEGQLYKVSRNLVFRPLELHRPINQCNWTTVDSIISMHMYLKRNELQVLSEQELCSTRSELTGEK